MCVDSIHRLATNEVKHCIVYSNSVPKNIYTRVLDSKVISSGWDVNMNIHKSKSCWVVL